MKEYTRSNIAAAAFAMVSGRSVNSVFSHDVARHRKVQATFRGGRLDAYDYDRGAYFQGDNGNLYDFGDSCHISMQINGVKVEGYHYGEGSYYEAKVSGTSVTIYDYATARWHDFSIL
jgi:hypothetical protein